MHAWRIFIAAVLLTLGLGCTPAPLRAETVVGEYRLQAAFVLNFARFAQWPATALPADNSPLVIGVLGTGPAGEALMALAGQVVGRHPVQVRQFAYPPAATDCQLLYVSDSETPQLDDLLRVLRSRSLLLVSDIPRFAERGGHIQLFNRQNKLRFRVNLQALGRAGLSLSSKLLKLADVVEAP